MAQPLSGLFRDVLRDFSRSWRTLTRTDLGYRLIAVAVLAPVVALFLKYLLSRTGAAVAADADIARFFFTTRPGVIAIVVGGALLWGITAGNLACLMAVAMDTAHGGGIRARQALAFAAKRAPAIVRLTGHMVLRVLVSLIPFAAIGGLVYMTLLHEHDINFYLSRKPKEFWIAASIVGVLATALVALLIRIVTRWTFALPLILFEGVAPRHALKESAARSNGHRVRIALAIAVWLAIALILPFLGRALVDAIVLQIAPLFAGSLSLLLIFATLLFLLFFAVVFTVAVFQASTFALIVTRLYRDASPDKVPAADRALDAAEQRAYVKGRGWVVLAGVGVFGAAGLALLALLITRVQHDVLVIAHRGASAEAPENSLAAFRLAGDERADFIELDVQESIDGTVFVVHDSDLMKVAGLPDKIWDTTAAKLAGADIGSRIGPQFATERLPTLAEALAVAKGHTKVVVELKSYGHNQQLEQRVVDLVEGAGMADQCIFMSLDHAMVRRLKNLRPDWRVGILLAKAFGDSTTLQADFLAVEKSNVNARFVRRAHRAGKDVYVWTLNEPAAMVDVMSVGADGLITDKPGLARIVVERRAAMSDAQRLLVALMVRAGANTKTLASSDELRP